MLDVVAVGGAAAGFPPAGTVVAAGQADRAASAVVGAAAAWEPAGAAQGRGMGRSVAVESSCPPSGLSTLRGDGVMGLDADGFDARLRRYSTNGAAEMISHSLAGDFRDQPASASAVWASSR